MGVGLYKTGSSIAGHPRLADVDDDIRNVIFDAVRLDLQFLKLQSLVGCILHQMEGPTQVCDFGG